jgi:hypothetical protein
MTHFLKAVILILCLAPAFVQAQQFNAGIKGGISATQISGDNLAGYDKAGIFLSPFVNVYISPYAAIQMEIGFIQKGSRKNPNPEKNDFTEYRLNLNYLEIPLLYRLDFNDAFSAEGGFSLAALVGSNEEAYPPIAPPPDFNQLDVGLILGGYFHFADQWYANVRLSHSILPVREHRSGATYRLNHGQYNSVLILAIQYQINRSQQ